MTANTEILNFANRYGYSDVEPYEIVRRVSDKTIEIRAMKAERDPNWKMEWVRGGFSGVCVNQSEQQWIITSYPQGYVTRIRLRKDGRWYDRGGNRYALSSKPDKFRDYNF